MSNPHDYTVGWICAISTEYVAARAFLDKEHDKVDYVSSSDNNVYTLGEIGRHNVVIATLPEGEYGIAAAASVAGDMLNSFPNIRFGLMVGIGGGAPSQKHDIRLGDVIVSAPRDGNSGILQYDFGKTIQGQEFHITGFLDQPPSLLRAAITGLKAQYEEQGHRLNDAIDTVLESRPRLQKKYRKPDQGSDRLYHSQFIHPLDSLSCLTVCSDNQANIISRPERSANEDNPAIHYGLIASANQLMKNALVRDKLATEKNVLCFEMEAAGLMNRFPCLVIRGICDYSDSHKNKEWQGYAAMVAAAYATDLLRQIAPNRVKEEKKLLDILSNIAGNQKDTSEHVRSMQHDITLSKLNAVETAAYDSHDNEHKPLCYPNTRVNLLRQINIWVDKPHSKCMYWLQGMAGTGKSTIARTIARELDERGALGASFFFKRGEENRSKAARLFSSIAAQLVHKRPSLAEHVRHVLRINQSITEKAIHEQFKNLILYPLTKVNFELGPTIVVVDALDECDCEEDAQTIISLLPQLRIQNQGCVKFFITSRPESMIRYQFHTLSGGYQGLVLQDVPSFITKDDITTFLVQRFTKIRDAYNQVTCHLPSDWPGENRLQKLAQLATPLFIFAETSCRFIEDARYGGGGPDGRLQKIIDHQFLGQKNDVNAMYLLILNSSVGDEATEEFQDIVGSIAVLARPLSICSLSRLLGTQEILIHERLGLLHSLLSIPTEKDAPVRILHLSFRDYLVNPEYHKSDQFWIDEKKLHGKLATRCLDRLMDSALKRDMCDLQISGLFREDINSEIIESNLPSSVQYACLFWVYHLKGNGAILHDGHQAFQFLRSNFLYWLEALSLLGRSLEATRLINELQGLVGAHNSTQVSLFLNDAYRFILNAGLIIDKAPLQLYSSALVFCPKRSIIRRTFQDLITWIPTKPLTQYWNACLQTLEGHNGRVTSVTFSGDARQLATGSYDRTIKVWDVATGTLQHTFEGHKGSISLVAFSRDARQLASGSSDKSIKIWDLPTEALRHTLEGHKDSLASVTFSGDRRQLASGSYDKSVKIWDVVTGTLLHTLDGHQGLVLFVAFSDDARQLISGSFDSTIKTWDTATGSLQRSLSVNNDEYWTGRIAFSNDGRQIASVTIRDMMNTAIQIRDTVTGELQRTIKAGGFCLPTMASIVFFGNGKRLACRLPEHPLKIWDTATGTLQHTLQIHDPAELSIAVSDDGKRLASVGSADNAAKIWDTITEASQFTFDGHDSDIRSVKFSKNGKRLVSISEENTVKIWDTATGALQLTLHNDLVQAVSFSSDDRQLAFLTRDGIVEIWSMATGELQHSLEADMGVFSIAFASDDKQLASATIDGIVEIWDVTTGLLQHRFEHTLKEYSTFELVSFSSNDKQFAFGSHNNTIQIWDKASGMLRHTLHHKLLQKSYSHKNGLLSAAFDSNGKWLASASMDETIKIWDTNSGALQHTLQHMLEPGRSELSISFSSNGKQLASGSTDKTIKIWDVATGVLQRTFEGFSRTTSVVSFSTDCSGSALLTNFGLIRVKRASATDKTAPSTLSQFQPQPQPWTKTKFQTLPAGSPHFQGYAISLDNSWITFNGCNVLWLPPDYRPIVSSVSSSEATIALGCYSRKVIILGFPAIGPLNGS